MRNYRPDLGSSVERNSTHVMATMSYSDVRRCYSPRGLFCFSMFSGAATFRPTALPSKRHLGAIITPRSWRTIGATSTILGAGWMIPPAADLPLTIKKFVREVLEGELLRSL